MEPAREITEQETEWEEAPTVILALNDLRREQQKLKRTVDHNSGTVDSLSERVLRLAADVELLAQTTQELNRLLTQKSEWVLKFFERFFGLIETVATRVGWRTILALAVLVLVFGSWQTGELGPLLEEVGRAFRVYLSRGK